MTWPYCLRLFCFFRMDFESLQIMALLNTLNELIDMNDQDAEVQAPEQSQTHIQPTQTQAPRMRRKTSTVWDDFFFSRFRK